MTQQTQIRGQRVQPVADPPGIVYDAAGRAWTHEDIRRHWRRTARTKMRTAFAERGHTATVADEVTFAMQSAMRGYRGPDLPSEPVPYFNLAWDGAQEGHWQAWVQPTDPADPAERDAEDSAPTLVHGHARGQQARPLFTASLNRPNGTRSHDLP